MNEIDIERFDPPAEGRIAVFIDTNALFPYYYEHDDPEKHEDINNFFSAVAQGELPYDPLLTNYYVLDELITLLISRADNQRAHEAAKSLLENNPVQVLYVSESTTEHAVKNFYQYEDQGISFTDHVIGVQAENLAESHRIQCCVLTYDQTHFQVLDQAPIPYY
jgi:predicted nucleic acid-binding protein